MSVIDSTAAGPHSRERARASFYLGITSFVLCVFTGVPAIWKGGRILVEMRGDPDRRGELRLACAGILLGLLGSALGLYLVFSAVAGLQESARRLQIV